MLQVFEKVAILALIYMQYSFTVSVDIEVQTVGGYIYAGTIAFIIICFICFVAFGMIKPLKSVYLKRKQLQRRKYLVKK